MFVCLLVCFPWFTAISFYDIQHRPFPRTGGVPGGEPSDGPGPGVPVTVRLLPVGHLADGQPSRYVQHGHHGVLHRPGHRPVLRAGLLHRAAPSAPAAADQRLPLPASPVPLKRRQAFADMHRHAADGVCLLPVVCPSESLWACCRRCVSFASVSVPLKVCGHAADGVCLLPVVCPSESLWACCRRCVSFASVSVPLKVCGHAADGVCLLPVCLSLCKSVGMLQTVCVFCQLSVPLQVCRHAADGRQYDGLLGGWLTGWLADLLVYWLVDRLICWLIDRLVHWLVDRQLAGLPVGWRTCRLVG